VRPTPEQVASVLCLALCMGLILCAWGLGIIGPRGNISLVLFGILLSWAALRLLDARNPRN
jgi:hypothetical protein